MSKNKKTSQGLSDLTTLTDEQKQDKLFIQIFDHFLTVSCDDPECGNHNAVNDGNNGAWKPTGKPYTRVFPHQIAKPFQDILNVDESTFRDTQNRLIERGVFDLSWSRNGKPRLGYRYIPKEQQTKPKKAGADDRRSELMRRFKVNL